MLRKHMRYLILIAACIMFVMPAVAQSRSFVWDRWDVVINNIDTTENRFNVVERQTITFNGTFRFGFRLIELGRLDGISNVRVFEDGRELSRGCSDAPGTVCVQEAREGLLIEYFFTQPVTNRSVDVRIAYTVNGALRSYIEGDQLGWFAVPQDHNAPVRGSVIVVNMPQDAIPREAVDFVEIYGTQAAVDVCFEMNCAGVNLRDYITEIDGAAAVARITQPLSADVPLEIIVQYPHNPNMPAPAYQAALDRERALGPVLNMLNLIVTILIALGSPLVMFALYYTRGRDPHVGPVPEYLSEPPSDVPPAVVGTLRDEKADLRDILSTLIDLAQRGYLVIEEEKEDGGFMGLGSKSTFTLKRTNQPDSNLKRFERSILSRIFGRSLEKPLESLKYKFYKYVPELQRDLYTLTVDHGFFGRRPDTVRNLWTGLGVSVMIVAGVIMWLSFMMAGEDNISFSMFTIPGATLFAGVVITIFGRFMPAKSQKGALEAAKWQAFERYLKNLEQYTDAAQVTEQFDKYLPYAIAFGIDKDWIRHFSGLDRQPFPMWYYPVYLGPRWSGGYRAGSAPPGQQSYRDMLSGAPVGSGGEGLGLDQAATGISQGLESISSGLTEMLNSTASVLTSQPSSSGSGGSWGGGFSGGGGFSSGGGGAGFG